MENHSAKRRRISTGLFSDVSDLHGHGDITPHSDATKWQGWAEIESDPAFFTTMLKDMGIHGLVVKEIYSLDAEMLDFLPRPVYGIIFLFRWREDDEFVDTRFKAGTKIWFANQTVSNACASYALLNIVNNISDIHLGPQLEHFREFTKDFTPSLRGDALSNFEFVKHIHNSFARRMDKLSSDLFMKNQYELHRTTGQKRGTSNKNESDDDEAAHHFIAFMPIDDVLWKMDGLEWQPRSLGRLKHEDWLQQIKSDIESRMSRYAEGEIEFAILAVSKDPMDSYLGQLAVSVKSLQQISIRAAEIGLSLDPALLSEPSLLGPSTSYNLTSDMIAIASVPEAIQRSICKGEAQELITLATELCDQQKVRRREIREEQDSRRADEARVARRRHDAGEAIRRWLGHLVNKQMIKPILKECSF